MKSHADSNSRPTFATTTIAVESPGKADIKEDLSDLLSVTGESRMVPAGISEVGSSDSSQAAIPSIALHSPIRRLSWFPTNPLLGTRE